MCEILRSRIVTRSTANCLFHHASFALAMIMDDVNSQRAEGIGGGTATLCNEAMSLLRHVRRHRFGFCSEDCGMGPDAKRRLSKSALHDHTH